MVSATLLTGLTVTSNMVGSVTLVIPELFRKQGLLSCIIVIAFMCAVYCKTCQLWTKHQRRDEDDISQIVRRTLGQRWFVVLGVSSGLFLMLLCIIYFLLLNQTLFPVIRVMLIAFGVSKDSIQPDNTGVCFNRISIQYLGVLMALCLAPMFNLRKIDRVLIVARYGASALLLYFAMILVMFGLSIAQGNVVPASIVLWAPSVDGWIEIAGLFSLAFISHNTIAPIMKNNPNFQDNPRSVAYGYAFAAVLYMLLGVFGGVAIQTYDYFNDTAFIIARGLLIFSYIVSIFGIFPFVSRTQFFCFLPQGTTIPPKYIYAYNLTTWVLCLVFQALNVSPGTVISITGTGVGLFVCFVIPIYIHLKCYYPGWREQPERQEGEITYTNSLIVSEEANVDDLIRTDLTVNTKKPSLLQSQTSGSEIVEFRGCVEHYNVSSWSFRTRIAFYGLLMLVGLTNFGLQIKLIVDSLVDST